MLIQFKTGNYRSFKEDAILSMVASPIKELPENVFNAIRKFDLLKSAVVYGPNASGKSNLLKAMRFMRKFILVSSKDTQQGEAIDVNPFKLNTETENKPCSFEIIFICEEVIYRYGFELDNKKIHNEWLFLNSQAKGSREVNLFFRENQKVELGSLFKEGKDLIEKTRGNALFLSVVAQFNGEISSKILNWFRNKIHVVNDYSMLLNRTLNKLSSNDSLLNTIKPFILAADLGVSDMKVQITKELIDSLKIPQGMKEKIKKDSGKNEIEVGEIHLIHDKFNKDGNAVGVEEFEIEDMESEGTKKMFAVSVPIIDALQNGEVFVIDELETHLHPYLVRFLVKLFNSNKNQKNAQLIFTSHNTECLSSECFRRDQIWFIEKDKFSSSKLYSLVEFKQGDKKIRNDERYDKNYLLGKYGAVPAVAEPEAVYGNNNNENKK